MRRFVFAATVSGVALSLATGGPAAAQIELGPVTAIATRAETPVERLPAAVTIIDAEEIERRGYQTLDEALRTVPGMTVVRSGPVGAQTSAFLRGSESDHVLVLIDGVPVNDPSAPGNAFNFGNDLLGAFDRIEIIRGPASNLYGTNAIGGVVNLVTRRAVEDGYTASAQVAAGNRQTFAGQANGTVRQGPFDAAFTVEGLRTDGDNITPDRIASAFDEDDGAELAALTATAGVDFGFGGRVEGAVRYRRNEFDLDRTGADDPNMEGENDQLALRVTTTAPITESVDVRAVVGFTRDDREFLNRPDAASTTIQDDSFEGERLFGDVQAIIRPDLATAGLAASTLIVGASVTDDSIDQSTNTDSGFGAFIQTARASSTDAAVFANGSGTLFDTLDVTVGVRAELPEDFDTTLTWRAGTAYRFTALPLRVFASAGTAFKAPSLFDRFGVNNFGFVGNPDLDPERSLSWEIGAEATLPAGALSQPVRAQLIYFGSRIDDLINFNPTFTSLENVDEAEIDGVEASVTLTPVPWADLALAYTYTDARNARTDTQLLRRPHHQGSVTVDLFPVDGLSLSGTARYVGERRDAIYDDTGTFVGSGGKADADTTVDVTGRYALTDGVTVFGEVTNLFDAEVEPANAFAAPGITALIGLRASL